jgi:dynein intermediate chain, cytosolic
MSSAYVPDFVDVEQELFVMPQKVWTIRNIHLFLTSLKEHIVYDKEVQTAPIDDDTGPTLEQLREQLRQEYEHVQQTQKDKELEEEAAKLDKEIEAEIRGQCRCSFGNSI